MKVNISQFKNIPVSYDELSSLLTTYNAPKNKVQEMERRGRIVRLKKGLYVLSEQESGIPPLPELVANHLHGPSYISMLTALRIYGLIPEHVYAIQSMTLGRTCEFENPIGRFSYVHAPADYYPIGIASRQSGDAFYQIALPEKALSDLIITTSGLQLRSVASAIEFLEEDLRFDMDALRSMDASLIEQCAMIGKKANTLQNLLKAIKNERI